MTSVAFVSPAHGRFAVTALVLAQRKRLIGELAACGIDAVSIITAADENLEVARAYGAEAVEVPNMPLGRKCNIGLQVAAARADWVVWIGSDDWVHRAVFDPLLEEEPSRTARVVSGRRMALVDCATGRLQRVAAQSQYGAVPWLVDSRLLRTNKRDLVPEGLNRGLDGGLIRGLRLARVPFSVVLHDPHDFRCVDFKTDENITPFQGLAKTLGIGAPEPAWETLADWFPADLVEMARKTSAMLPPPRRHAPRMEASEPPKRRIGGVKPVRMMHPETGEIMHASVAGAKVLASRGWTNPDAITPDAGPGPTADMEWPETHAGLDALAVERGVSWPAPPPGRMRLTVAEKIAVLKSDLAPA